MHLLSVDSVTASVEGRTLFADVSFGLTDDDRVGVVGPNGVGKTTLLRIVAGQRPPDRGQVVPRRGLRIAALAQDPALPAAPAHEVVAGADPAARPDEVEALLDRLGVAGELPLSRASGGERRRVALARTLLPPSDLIILDEPTNHLDVDAIDWLEEELGRRASGLVVVTHDRYLLERLTNRMLDLDRPGPEAPAVAHWHLGSYSSLLEARARRTEQRDRATTTARNLLRKEVAWLRRGARARTSKPKFRKEQVELLREAARGDPEARPLELATGRRRLGNDVFELAGVVVNRGGTRVLDGVDLVIGPGERVGVVGPNGAGKTTLLHLLAGRLDPEAGQLRVGATVEVGLYEQEARAAPAGGETVMDSVRSIAPHVPLATGETLPAHRLAERFGFDRELARTPVGLLSGGERRRLALLHVLVAAPNVLLLDEPTNDLDLDTLSVFEDYLDGFDGSLVVASHDRYVLDRLTDRTIALRDGQLSEHLDWREARAATGLRAARRSVEGTTDGRAGRAEENRARKQAQRRLRSVEQRIETLSAQRDRLVAAMAAVATDPEQLTALQAQLEPVERELAEVEETWLTLAAEH